MNILGLWIIWMTQGRELKIQDAMNNHLMAVDDMDDWGSWDQGSICDWIAQGSGWHEWLGVMSLVL